MRIVSRRRRRVEEEEEEVEPPPEAFSKCEKKNKRNGLLIRQS